MAFIGDTTKIKLQLKLTNFAESLPESKTRLHVWRISYLVTILDDDVDEQVVVGDKHVTEYQHELNWQAEAEDLQDDLHVRTALTQLSEKLCPYRNIATSLYDRVKSDDVVGQLIDERPLSSYRHLSFRSVMLTRHPGAGDGQPELLFQHDGLSGEQSSLRWRSHDYIKVTLCQPRPWFRVFWLIQWDIVDLQHHINEIIPPNEHQAPRSFHGVRRDVKRKSPWIAEVRPKGERKKLWLGSYKTPEAAARAVDVGKHYYHVDSDRLNFPDSPQCPAPVPHGLTAKDKEKFVKMEARRLASLTENLWQPSSLQPALPEGLFEGISTFDIGPPDFGLMWLNNSPVGIAQEDPLVFLNSLWEENSTQGDRSESRPGAESDDDFSDRRGSLPLSNVLDEIGGCW